MKTITAAVLTLVLVGASFVTPTIAAPMQDCGCWVPVTTCSSGQPAPFPSRIGRVVGHFDVNGTPQSLIESNECSTVWVHQHHDHHTPSD